MIKSLRLQNFQAHKDTHLQFHSGVNVIIGLSDSGKSAILRGMELVINNRPTGDATIRSHWGGDTKCTLQLDDCVVQRIRTKARNEYWLNNKKFTAFKTAVPEEIQQAININEVNTQWQLDSPFLIADSPGQVAQHFNRVAHLEKIDFATKNIRSWTTKKNSELDAAKSALDLVRENYRQVKHIPKLEVHVSILEKQADQVAKLHRTGKNLHKLLQYISDTEKERAKFTNIPDIKMQLNRTLSVFQSAQKIKNRIQTLKYLQTSIKRTRTSLATQKAIIAHKNSVEDIFLKSEQLHKQREYVKQLQILIKKIFEVRKTLNQSKKDVKQLRKDFEVEFPDVCPLCDQPKPKKI